MVSPSSYALSYGDFRPATCQIAVIHCTGIRMTLQSPNSSRSASPGAGFSCSPLATTSERGDPNSRFPPNQPPLPLTGQSFPGVITLRVMVPGPTGHSHMFVVWPSICKRVMAAEPTVLS